MADKLVQLSDTVNVTGKRLIIENYNTLCRHGIWVGWLETFTETVTLAYEHTEDPLYVGWQINGTTVVNPGYSLPSAAPSPGAPSVRYQCPVDSFFHEISLTSSSGDPAECLFVQVLFRGPTDQNNPAHYGPSMYVCLAGSRIEWPSEKVAQWEACLGAFWAKLRSYVEIAHVNPGDPVEWLASLPGDVAVRLQAGVETLEHLDAAAQPELAKAIKEDVLGILRARMPGTEHVHG